MKLSQEQQNGVDKIAKWLSDPKGDWNFNFGGAAGTGKTTTIQKLIGGMDREPLIAAPTGKAASVLQAKLKGEAKAEVKEGEAHPSGEKPKSGFSVTTIHKLIYQPQHQSTSEIEGMEKEVDNLLGSEDANAPKRVEELRENIKRLKRGLAQEEPEFSLKGIDVDKNKDLVIIDEASMVTEEMRDDLRNLGCRVLFVGDQNQLPPVKSDPWFHKSRLDFGLKEIHRQALESPIIRLSMAIRTGDLSKKDYQFDDCKIVGKEEVPKSEWVAADQVLTGRNVSRQRINRFMRKRLGHRDFGELPASGEKLICLKNQDKSGVYPAFINGVQCVSRSATDINPENDSCVIDLEYEGEDLSGVPFYDFHCRKHYNSDLDELPWKWRLHLREFDYAYAITVHKSQGSEWPFVILADDKMNKINKKFRKQWLYTAVTRAKEKLIWVQD